MRNATANGWRNGTAAAIALSLLCSLSGFARAQATQPAQAKDQSKEDTKLTVAILDFDAATPGNPDLGKQMAEALTATLTGESGFTLVDRSMLARTLQEHELNNVGLVNPANAIKIGQLVGAKILVSGKAFTLDKQLYVTAKIIGTETSKVEGVIVKGAADADVGPLVMSLSDKIATRLRETGQKLVAGAEGAGDPLPALQAQLAKLKLPKIAVSIPEQHVPFQRPVTRIDPAVETEIKMLLTQSGFTVIDGDEKELNRAGVEIVIGGEAFSEFAARIGNLVSCSARVELKLTHRADGKVLLVDRETQRGVDLSEQQAGKVALQKAGHAIGVRLLQHLAKTLPPADAATQKPAP